MRSPEEIILGTQCFDILLNQGFDPILVDQIRADWAHQEEGDCFIRLPYSDLGGWFPETSVHLTIPHHLPLWRLEGIKALSSLTPVGSNPQRSGHIPYDHTRYTHSFAVALMMEHILKINGFPDQQVTTGILAGWLHDNALPALGDATIKVDPSKLNEEDYWFETIDKQGWQFLQENNVYKHDLDEIIHNRGTLGQVLDIADKAVYVAFDASATVGSVTGASPIEIEQRRSDPYFGDIFYLLTQDPYLINIYQEVQINQEGGEVFFTNPTRLYRFLLLRAMLFDRVYTHPYNQTRDTILTTLIKPFYSPNENTDDPYLLTPHRLRRMSDLNLLEYLQDRYNTSCSSYNYTVDFIGLEPGYRRFDDEEQAQKFSQEISQQEDVLSLGVQYFKGFNPATDYLVQNPTSGNLLPYREFDSEGAAEIEGLAKPKGYFALYMTFANPTLAQALKNPPISRKIKKR